MNDPDGDGWGSPTAEALISIPQLNIVIMWVKIFHQLPGTELCETSYKQWIQEYKIDGFRWDLTKGFEQRR
jgi:hypothetical protein